MNAGGIVAFVTPLPLLGNLNMLLQLLSDHVYHRQKKSKGGKRSSCMRGNFGTDTTDNGHKHSHKGAAHQPTPHCLHTNTSPPSHSWNEVWKQYRSDGPDTSSSATNTPTILTPTSLFFTTTSTVTTTTNTPTATSTNTATSWPPTTITSLLFHWISPR